MSPVRTLYILTFVSRRLFGFDADPPGSSSANKTSRGVCMSVEQFEELLTEQDVSKQFKIPAVTLQQARHYERWGLKFIKIGKLVRYRRKDVLDFLAAQTRTGTHPAPPRPRKRKPKLTGRRGQKLLAR
jgi:hypothetical protein